MRVCLYACTRLTNLLKLLQDRKAVSTISTVFMMVNDDGSWKCTFRSLTNVCVRHATRLLYHCFCWSIPPIFAYDENSYFSIRPIRFYSFTGCCGAVSYAKQLTKHQFLVMIRGKISGCAESQFYWAEVIKSITQHCCQSALSIVATAQRDLSSCAAAQLRGNIAQK